MKATAKPGGWSSPKPARQLSRYIDVMEELPPSLPKGWWDDALERTYARALIEALGRISPDVLSARLMLAELRSLVDRIEASAQLGDDR